MDEPQYKPPKPFPWGDIAACLGIALVLAAILIPVFRATIRSGRSEACMSYLKDRTVGLLNYATDYDNHLPPAQRWQSAVVPYVKENAYACPELGRRSAPETGFGMDSRLSGIALEKLGYETDRRILLFETSNLVRNANDPGVSFATRHPALSSGPPRGWVTFTDGSMRVLTANQRSVMERGTYP